MLPINYTIQNPTWHGGLEFLVFGDIRYNTIGILNGVVRTLNLLNFLDILELSFDLIVRHMIIVAIMLLKLFLYGSLIIIYCSCLDFTFSRY